MTISRRTFERQRLWPPVLARTGSASALEVLDLSEAGAGVLSSEPLAPGETIRLEIPLPYPESAPLAPHVAEAMGETVWAAETGRAGIRFLDVPVDSRSLLQEWVRSSLFASEPAESQTVQLKILSAVPAQRATQFNHPWIVLAIAIGLGIAGGIWLATRQDPSAKKASVSTPPEQKIAKVPIDAAPLKGKTDGVTPIASQSKLPVAGSKERAASFPAAVPQPLKASIDAAPDQGKTKAAVLETAPVKQRTNKPGSPGVVDMLPSVQGMRFSHLPGLTRVEIDLGTSTLLRSGRLHNPERVYFDVRDSHREKGITRRLQERKVGDIDDAILTGVRVAPLRSGDVRVVLDLNRSCEFSHRLSSEPASSLIVELPKPFGAGGEAQKPK